MTGPLSTSRLLFLRSSWPEATRIAALLRRETVGGGLLLIATVVALGWANSPWVGAYTGLRDLTVGPAALHLDLSLGTWAADGLLAIFFFLAGLELKRSSSPEICGIRAALRCRWWRRSVAWRFLRCCS